MLAVQRVRTPALLDLLRQWAEDKYHLPWNHEVFQEQSVLELLTSFWEDYYRKHPVETKRTDTGDVVYTNTGDPLIDKWEQEIAQGLVPDLFEGLSPEKRQRSRQVREAKKDQQQRAITLAREVAAEGFTEDYRDRRNSR